MYSESIASQLMTPHTVSPAIRFWRTTRTRIHIDANTHTHIIHTYIHTHRSTYTHKTRTRQLWSSRSGHVYTAWVFTKVQIKSWTHGREYTNFYKNIVHTFIWLHVQGLPKFTEVNGLGHYKDRYHAAQPHSHTYSHTHPRHGARTCTQTRMHCTYAVNIHMSQTIATPMHTINIIYTYVHIYVYI